MKYVGIDVSAKELVVSILGAEDKSNQSKVFDNTATGYRKLIKHLQPKKYQSRVCMEATGVYHFDVAVALSKINNIELMVLNPKVASNFAKSLSTKSKTDAIDAITLGEYAKRMKFVPWRCPSVDELNVRSYARQLARLTQHKSKLKNQLHALKSSQTEPKEVIRVQEKTIVFYDKEIEKLEAVAIKFIATNKLLNSRFELLLSIKGVAKKSAIQLLGELSVLPSDMGKKQWVAHAGLHPVHCQSGSSINKKPYISRAGNRYLRCALYMPAISAATNDEHVRGFYLHLQEDNDLVKMQAICAIMRKLLHAIWGMFATDKPFDGASFYKLKTQTSC